MCADFIPINRPILDDAEIRAAQAVLESGILTSPSPDGGPAVQRLEHKVCDYTGSRYAVAVGSGTAALQAALMALDISVGDEVVVPSFSYVATANAVRSVGARPVFADISDDHTMNTDSLRNCIGPKTVAVIPVHLYGRVAHMDIISEISESAGIHVIEDAAQSLGSTIDGHHTGTLSEMGCYSLYPGKVATSGEGGIITTDNKTLKDRLCAVRNHGNTGDAFEVLGTNLRLPEISAAIGAVQMDKLPGFLERRRHNAARLSDILAESGLLLPRPRRHENPNWNLYTASSDDRDHLLDGLNRNGVGAAVYYRTPIHATPLYADGTTSLPETDRAAQTVISLPVHPGVGEAEIYRMTKIIKDQ